MNIEQAKEKIRKIADEIILNKELLTKLDRDIGDGDHGFNMAKGFTNVLSILNDDYSSMKDLFNKVAMTLISNVGGASGPLYGTFFMKFAMSLNTLTELDRNSFNEAFCQGVEGVKMRGKACIGDKTMIDVLDPCKKALLEGKNFDEIIKIAKESLDATEPMKARKGRATYLGERSIGHLDPGAYSSYIMIKAALEE